MWKPRSRASGEAGAAPRRPPEPKPHPHEFTNSPALGGRCQPSKLNVGRSSRLARFPDQALRFWGFLVWTRCTGLCLDKSPPDHRLINGPALAPHTRSSDLGGGGRGPGLLKGRPGLCCWMAPAAGPPRGATIEPASVKRCLTIRGQRRPIARITRPAVRYPQSAECV